MNKELVMKQLEFIDKYVNVEDLIEISRKKILAELRKTSPRDAIEFAVFYPFDLDLDD